MKIHIQGGTLIDPAAGSEQQQDVVHRGRQDRRARQRARRFRGDARPSTPRGLHIAPGLVDLSARLREPGFEHKATLESEMAAALAGGVTSLVCPPDTDPTLDEPGLVEMLKFRARKLDQAHVYPLGALTVGLKGQGHHRNGGADRGGLHRLLAGRRAGGRYAGADARAAICEDVRLHRVAASCGRVSRQGRRGRERRAGVAARPSGVPVAAETIALHTIFELVRVTGARVHLSHVSSAAGIALMREAKAEGLPVSCDVTVNHVHLIDLDIGYFDAQFPPRPAAAPAARSRSDPRGSRRRHRSTRSAPTTRPSTTTKNCCRSAKPTPGATGLELFLSLTVKWADEAGVPLAKALNRNHGRAGSTCSIWTRLAASPWAAWPTCACSTVDAHWRVEPRALKSQGHNTPFLGYELPARVRATIVSGRVAFEQR